jgi:hypothetical protein
MRRLRTLDVLLVVVFCVWVVCAVTLIAPFVESEAQAAPGKLPNNKCLAPPIPATGCNTLGYQSECPTGCSGTGNTCQGGNGNCTTGTAGCSGPDGNGDPTGCLCSIFSC